MNLNVSNLDNLDTVIAIGEPGGKCLVRAGEGGMIYLQPQLDTDGEILLNAKDLWRAIIRLGLDITVGDGFATGVSSANTAELVGPEPARK